MAQAIHERIKIIDADSHISEPATLWTDRVSTEKWGDLVPHVQFDPEISEDRWFIIFVTRAFYGFDDDRSILYQIRSGLPTAP